MSERDNELKPEPNENEAIEDEQARLPESYVQEDEEEEEEYESTLDDEWGDDDEGLTEEEWEELGERQAARAAVDPAYARWREYILNSPAMLPAVPRRPAGDEDDEDDWVVVDDEE
jgi:hypothetical protein